MERRRGRARKLARAEQGARKQMGACTPTPRTWKATICLPMLGAITA